MKISPIYRNIFFYRSVMQILYGFNYLRCFRFVKSNIIDESVSELCFGDTVLEDYRFKNNIKWSGYNFNHKFVNRAIKIGHNVSRIYLTLNSKPQYLIKKVIKKKMTSNLITRFNQNPRKIFLFFSFLSIVAVLLSVNIPFFWDNITISESASFYFNNSFRKIIPSQKLDYGVITLYAYYLAACWKIMGQSLLVSHIAIITFVVGIFWEVKNISLHFIKPGSLFLVYLLLLFDPAISTQIVLIGYDIVFLYFALLAIRTLIEKKYLFFSISLLLLSTISIRAIVFIFCLLLVQLIFILIIEKNRLKINDYLCYIPALIFLICWCIYHLNKTGWLFFTPEKNSFRDTNSLNMVFRQFGFIIWKLVDSGRIFIWLLCSVGFFVFYQKIKISAELKKILIILIIPLLMNIGVMIFISNPIGHKYFLITFTILSIFAVYFIQNINSKKHRILIFASILLCLFFGNFIVYPQKYGNAWDTSLKVLPYFKLEQNMRTFIQSDKIDPKEIHTEFPLNNDFKYSYLQNDFSYSDLEVTEIPRYKYILYSNILNVRNLQPYEEVKQNWVLVKEMSSFQISIELYKNPKL